MVERENETTDVITCCCSPTGAMLSAYLGQMFIPHILIEEVESTVESRVIALDEDGIRLLQGIGFHGHICSDIRTCENTLEMLCPSHR
jgi:2-polyprenyl-6-methoxyphenol hydroxylase-like FAD-dependent oxidoreductase